MLIFYKYSGQRPEFNIDTSDLEVKIEAPFVLNNPYYNSLKHKIRPMIWIVLSKIRRKYYKSYNLYKNGSIVSTSEVCENLFFFPFLGKNGIHIGPCDTLESQRGKGYYPYLLRCIQNDFSKRDVYIIVDENNRSSINGIRKAGFIEIGTGKKNKIGQYLINK